MKTIFEKLSAKNILNLEMVIVLTSALGMKLDDIKALGVIVPKEMSEDFYHGLLAGLCGVNSIMIKDPEILNAVLSTAIEECLDELRKIRLQSN